VLWENIAEICDKQLGADFESVAKCWLSDKKFRALNVCISTIFSSIWKLRNDMCFSGCRLAKNGGAVEERCKNDARLASLKQPSRCRKARDPKMPKS
jgi:hypothetical protein